MTRILALQKLKAGSTSGRYGSIHSAIGGITSCHCPANN